MPARIAALGAPVAAGSVPAQSCSFCHQIFCNVYFGGCPCPPVYGSAVAACMSKLAGPAPDPAPPLTRRRHQVYASRA